ncbi:alpha-aminoadipic semialdehyde synthase, mitochondrial [Olea europaea subsp. europaea]|uniref:Alpha-aminoadipic semialdehyde synthase, mitochondrial n=1 Tax=Olea europaea subsp. europaea TaxID=158383 RepID=A0A8S0TNH8_OLEEU|nr:alpha-aminoadipic semialdehyde synthase, mitochondrial [Olea europaea subsp. europaea]
MPLATSLTWAPARLSQELARRRRHFHLAGHLAGRNAPRHVVAIRREDASIWERRAPLAPYHVEKLTKQGVRILVQPSNRRVYPLQSYIRAGAEAKEDISEASVILGVKQVPVDLLLPNKTYCFFSHTIKAQEANMPLLDAILDKNIRLIDYERMVDERDQRVVAFGKYAGYAGMIDILHGIGLRLLALGHHTPFMHIGPAHNYRNVGSAKQAIRDAGYEIALGKMPRSIGPLTFVFTGSGNVSQGAQEVFAELPIEFVDPADLREVAERGSTSKIYGTCVTRADHLVRKKSAPPPEADGNATGGGAQVDMDEYQQHPERYYSNFSTKIAPYASVIMNGVYWPPNAPRLLTIPDAKRLQQPSYKLTGANRNNGNGAHQGPPEQRLLDLGLSSAASDDGQAQQQQLLRSTGSPSLPHRLIAICDISADPGGSIEFMQECTTIDNPFYLYDAEENSPSDQSFAGNGFLICSIDNMPTQLPLESTDMFGNLLFPYIMDIVKSDATKPLEEEQYTNAVSKAIIASNGSLQPSYEYIQELRSNQDVTKYNRSSNTREVLVLGAGHVSGPLIEYLCRDPKILVTVVSSLEQEVDKNKKYATKHNNLRTIIMDVTQKHEHLSTLVEQTDLVVSLLPYTLHPMIAKMCIAGKTNMVTASYLSQELRELDQAARDAGITVVNEVGLDPGIDHLLAKQVIDEVASSDGKITKFVSYCCGLPTPEFADNPLGYKFGWNPAGAFAITMNGARWKENNQVMRAEPGQLMDFAMPVDGFLRGFSLEAFPNRDSIEYQDLYNLPDAKTVIRGSMRYQGFSETIRALRHMGLMDQSPHPCLQADNGAELTWRQFMAELLGHSNDIALSTLKALVLEKVGKSNRYLQSIIQLGLLDDEPVIKCGTPFDTTRLKIIRRYPFKAGENDLIIMRIMFDIEWADRAREEKCLTMVVYGQEAMGGFSAMAKTVGYPAAIASKMVLEGEIQNKGMLVPLQPEIYRPMLKRLKNEGIYTH